MKKAFRILGKVISGIIIFIVMVPIFLSIILQINPIQKYIIDSLTGFITSKTNTIVSVSEVSIGIFNHLYLKDAYFEDYSHDTMIYVKEADITIKGFDFLNSKLDIGKIQMDSANIRLCKCLNGETNFKQVFQKLKSENPTEINIDLNGENIKLLNSRFRFYDSINYSEKRNGQVNFKDLDIHDINVYINGIDYTKGDISLDSLNINFKEKSGFSLKGLGIHGAIFNKKDGIGIHKVAITTEGTNLASENILSDFGTGVSINDATVYINFADGSKFSTLDLSYFLNNDFSVPITAGIQGSIHGKISEIDGSIHIDSYGNILESKFNIQGLPELKSTKFNIAIDNLETSATSIETTITEIGRKREVKPLNENVIKILTRLGHIHISGAIDGSPDLFKTNLKVTTDCGNISMNGYARPENKFIKTSGIIFTDSLAIGKALALPKVGHVSLEASTNAEISLKEGIKADGTINLNELKYGTYTFKQIIANGKIEDRRFYGNITSHNDPNFILTADGNCDFISDSLPSYDFKVALDKADFVALGLNKDEEKSEVKAVFNAAFTGNDIDNLNGKASFDSLRLITENDTIYSKAIIINCKSSENNHIVNIESKSIDIDFIAHDSYRNLVPSLKRLAIQYFPSYNDAKEIVRIYDETIDNLNVEEYEASSKTGDYNLTITAKERSPLFRMLLPGLDISKGSFINFSLNPKKNLFSFNVKSDYITRRNMFVEDLKIESHNGVDSLYLNLDIESLNAGKFQFENLGLHSSIKDNTIKLKAFFNDTTNMADFNLQAKYINKDEDRNEAIVMNLLPSKFKIDTSEWTIRNNVITIDTSSINIDSIVFRSGIQNIIVNGNIGKTKNDSLSIAINNLDISPATMIIKDAGYDISAIANGKVDMVSLLNERILKGRINLDNIFFTGEDLGSCYVESIYDNPNNRLLLDLTADDGTKPVNGFYSINNRVLDLDIHFPRLRLCLLSPILRGTLNNMTGTADTKVNFKLIRGKIPVINGEADINNFSTVVAATLVKYSVPKGHVTVKDNHISMSNTTIYDSEGNTAVASGYFQSADFRELVYSINAHTDRILGLNTTKENNETFFGKVYGSGSFYIDGNERKTTIKVSARTAYGSTFNMPFSSVATIEQDKFITFIDPSLKTADETERKKRQFFNRLKRAKYSAETDLTLDIIATPDVEANIEYVNSYVTNLIQGTGQGRLILHYNPTQEIFTLNGNLNIEKGTYRMIFYLADKTFNLKSGSVISWDGNPTDPKVNFTGVYQTRASIQPLLANSIRSSNSVTQIDCGIHLTESLFSPQISFEISAPQADPETQSIIKNAISTQESLSTQFFSLFLTNSFTTETGAGNQGVANIGTSLVSTTGFEFLSNQISSLLSTKNFTWRPTYKPRTERSSDEFGVQTEVNLLQNKLTLNFEGRYYVNPTYNNRKNPFSGGGDINLKLNPKGTLNLKAFTRVVDRFDETQGLQESGMGVYFHQEFNDWNDLKYRIHKNREERKERRELNHLIDSTKKTNYKLKKAGILFENSDTTQITKD